VFKANCNANSSIVKTTNLTPFFKKNHFLSTLFHNLGKKTVNSFFFWHLAIGLLVMFIIVLVPQIKTILNFFTIKLYQIKDWDKLL